MNVSEHLLLSLSKAPDGHDYPPTIADLSPDNALDLLKRVFPGFDGLVSGKRIVDFGCGFGDQSVALVKKHGCSVVGIDSSPATLRRARERARARGVSSESLCFAEAVSADMLGRFHAVISQNSFEHFANPARVLEDMASLLKEDGVVLITFGPPWLAPYGSHMYFFCRAPWVNVFFPEETVMSVRARFRQDGAKRYEDAELGLNRMTIAKFESIVSASSLKMKYKNYECVKGVDVLARVPLVREFFINQVTAILSKGG